MHYFQEGEALALEAALEDMDATAPFTILYPSNHIQ